MAEVERDLVKETTTTTGTGAKTTSNTARSPGRTIGSVLANGDTAEFIIWHATLNEWEIGRYTYSTSGPTLTIVGSPYASSNSGSVVNFSAGTKLISLVDPASRASRGAKLTQTSAQTQTANVTNLTAGAYTIKANTLEVGSEYEWEAVFYAGRGGTTTATNLIIELLVNGVAVRTLTLAITTTASANRGGKVWGRFTIRTLGASGTMMVSLESLNDVVGSAGTQTSFIDPARSGTSPGTTTIDTTVDRSTELRMRMSVNTATVYIHLLHCTLTKIR